MCYSVILVLMSFDIVLQVDLDLPCHLWPNVLEEATSNQANDAEPQQRQRDRSGR